MVSKIWFLGTIIVIVSDGCFEIGWLIQLVPNALSSPQFVCNSYVVCNIAALFLTLMQLGMINGLW